MFEIVTLVRQKPDSHASERTFQIDLRLTSLLFDLKPYLTSFIDV